MRFMCIYTPDQSSGPDPKKYAEMSKFTDEMAKAGVFLEGGGLLPPAARLRMNGGKVSVTDGPFPETKEVIVGYAILQAKSKEECIEHCKRFLKIAGDGVSEIRQLADEPG
jgi:hypothetical protein